MKKIALQLAWRGARPTTRPTPKTTLYYVGSTARLNSCPIETIGRKESNDENVRTNPKAAQKIFKEVTHYACNSPGLGKSNWRNAHR